MFGLLHGDAIKRKDKTIQLDFQLLADFCDVTKPRISQVIKELEANDLVLIKEDEQRLFMTLLNADEHESKNVFDGITNNLEEDKRELLDIWVDYRKELKKPYKTRAAAKKVINLFEKFSFSDMKDAVEASIANEWQGLFPSESQKESKGYNYL